MGVFLSKPCLDKFSDDGEDEGVMFGVSSMQGWRKNMEDAHLAVLDLHGLGAEEGVGSRGGEVRQDGEVKEQQLQGNGKVRLFGVFDGHGGDVIFSHASWRSHIFAVTEPTSEISRGKEVALFVQEHLAKELVNLGEYRKGDYPGALARSFHRMDEMLEVAANELRRRRQVNATEMGAGGGMGMIANSILGGEAFTGRGKGMGAGELGAPNGVGGVGATEGAETDAAAAGERAQGETFVQKLNSYRATKNPSELEAERQSNTEHEDGDSQGSLDSKDESFGSEDPVKPGSGSDSFPEDEEITVVPTPRDAAGGAEGSASDGGPLGEAGEGTGSGTGAGASGGVGGAGGGSAPHGGEKIKMADALDLFQRILHMGGSRMSRDEATKGDDDGESRGGLLGAGGNGKSAGDVGSKGGEAEDDAFCDNDPEDDDDVLPNGGAPRTGLGASVASMVVGMDGPTCNLRDHPIQAGCTSVVCLMVGNMLYVANAGDSRAVLCRGVAALELSKDHKPLAEGEKDRIEGAGGFVNAVGRVNGNLNLSRSIGDLKYKANTGLPPASQMITAEPDVRSLEITEQDRFVVLACDGVWDCMTSQECVDFVGARLGKMSLSKICEEVMDYCISDDPRRTQGIGGDNMTCVIILLDKILVTQEAEAQDKSMAGRVVEATSSSL